MTTTLASMLAIIGLGPWEVVVIILALMFPVAAVGAIIFIVVRSSSRSRRSSPPHYEPANSPAPRRCPQCGADLKADAPEGLCPACLLKRGIATEGGVPPGTPPFTPPSLAGLAKLFPQLEIIEPIGQGGMGAVYKARQPALDRLVALKILAPRGGGDVDFAGRFTREARALARLSHPNIVAVHDFGQVLLPSSPDPRPLNYFLMEYVDGPNLRQLEQAGKLSPREALQIIPQICAALQFAHDEGVVHRDIKPENVLLDKKGRVKIADFGLAKILGQETDFRLTGARDVMGTPHYMAPEQVEKPQEVDHRADIYSLGVVFYEMLTGELPLGKFEPPSRRAQVDVRLDEVVLRSLEKSPERRYQHVSEVQTEVETIVRMPAKPPAGSSVKGFRIAIGLGMAVVVLAFLGFVTAIAIPVFSKARSARTNSLHTVEKSPSLVKQPSVEPTKITVSGIVTILGVKKALLTVPGSSPGVAAEDLILAEGQTQSDIAVNEIDEKAGVVKVNNHGVSQTLLLERGAARVSNSPGRNLSELPPVVVQTDPASGAQDVPAGETEIRVRFNKPMMDRAWNWLSAWTNSSPQFLGDPHYLSDGRTCVLKVRLEPGRIYGIWLNSDSANNFRDQRGRSAVPYLLTFQTQNK